MLMWFGPDIKLIPVKLLCVQQARLLICALVTLFCDTIPASIRSQPGLVNRLELPSKVQLSSAVTLFQAGDNYAMKVNSSTCSCVCNRAAELLEAGL